MVGQQLDRLQGALLGLGDVLFDIQIGQHQQGIAGLFLATRMQQQPGEALVGFEVVGVELQYAAEQGRVVKPDQFADRGYFYRSDQFSFAKIGVPAMYLDPGTDFIDRPPEYGRQIVEEYTNKHYHQPSDEYDPNWNLEGMIEDAKIGFWVGLAIANNDEMPTWNEGDEFEAVRLESLAEEE